MRLGKEQAAGYVEDIESDVTERISEPAAAVAADSPLMVAEQEPAALPR